MHNDGSVTIGECASAAAAAGTYTYRKWVGNSRASDNAKLYLGSVGAAGPERKGNVLINICARPHSQLNCTATAATGSFVLHHIHVYIVAYREFIVTTCVWACQPDLRVHPHRD